MKKIAKSQLLLIGDYDFLQVLLKEQLPGSDLTFLPHDQGLSKILEMRRVDLIILDIALPGKDGFYWLGWIQQFHPQIPVILASAQATADERLKGLLAGALDYLTKPFHVRELAIRIENILHRSSTHTMQKIVRIGNIKLDFRTNCVHKNGTKSCLTQMEADILKFLYLNSGAVVSRDEIMAHIRGIKYNPLDRSIDIHINKIRKKIASNPAHPSLIRTVRGKGYSLQLLQSEMKKEPVGV